MRKLQLVIAFFSLVLVLEVMAAEKPKEECDLKNVVRNGTLAEIHAQIKMGCDINAQNDKGKLTALHAATMAEDVEVMQILIKAGANVNMKDMTGKTALHWAAMFHAPEEAELLLNSGAKVDSLDEKKRTALHMVAMTGVGPAGLLIDKGASLSLKSGNGLTPLHYAVVGGHERMIVLLLKKGARVDVLDSQGRTPLQLAKIYNSESAMELLADPEKAKQKVFKPRKHKHNHKHHDHGPEDEACEPEKEKAAER